MLILGCTHYPLVVELFEAALGKKIEIFDPATAVAKRVEKVFGPEEQGSGATRYLVSQDSEPFRALVSRLFPHEQLMLEVVE